MLISNRRSNLSKRKTGASRNQESKYYSKKDTPQTYYTHESKTIQFDSVRPKTNPRHVELIPKTANQEKYIVSLLDSDLDIVIASGPAGTGKTYLAMQAAIKNLKSGQIEKIILTRPAVGVEDEKHGFLPGDLNAKMEPWTKPLLDVLREYYNSKEIAHMLEEQMVEIVPLAFCRGRNFKNSFIVLDEAQNCTPNQLKMIMTRIGVNSKLVITGDIDQADRKSNDNGLLDLKKRLKETQVPGLKFCDLEMKDVQRHKIIEHILRLYN
jgi:phosphate starvation-inducible PhoH-like protein